MKVPVFLVAVCVAIFACRLAVAKPETPTGLRAIPLKTIEGKSTSLNAWAGKVLLVVNVASQCGNTPQYAGLEALHNKYRDRGFSVLGFPCNDFGGQEPGTAEEIKAFCKTEYRVTFPLFEKLHVKGAEQHPLYAALTGKSSPVPGAVTWNFGKFLIGKDGKILKRWEPDVKPDAKEITDAVELALATGTAVSGGRPPAARPVAFFGTPAAGNDIVFCLDTGSAMRALAEVDGIAAVRRELKRVITEFPPEMSFNVVCYGACADLFKPASVPATSEMKNEALRFLEGYYGGASAGFGRTRTEKFQRAGKDSQGIEYVPVMPEDIKDLAGIGGPNRIDLAMAAAFQRNPATVFVVSAGLPRPKKEGVELEPREIIDTLYAAWQKIAEGKNRTVVHTISMHSETLDGTEGRKFLQSLALKFGGKHRDVRPPKAQPDAPEKKASGAKRA